MNKYEDMVYMNQRGMVWFKTLYEPAVWNRWVSKVKRSMRTNKVEGTPEQYAQRIILEALWHRGYAKDLNDPRTLARCARRLRKPPDRGAGASKGDFYLDAIDLESQALPRELVMLDEFLENEVRPTIHL